MTITTRMLPASGATVTGTISLPAEPGVFKVAGDSRLLRGHAANAPERFDIDADDEEIIAQFA
jgi:hypothetical protein